VEPCGQSNEWRVFEMRSDGDTDYVVWGSMQGGIVQRANDNENTLLHGYNADSDTSA